MPSVGQVDEAVGDEDDPYNAELVRFEEALAAMRAAGERIAVISKTIARIERQTPALYRIEQAADQPGLRLSDNP